MPTASFNLTDSQGHATQVSAAFTVEAAVGTFFGACPANPGGESLTAANTVITKWGAGASVRQFFTGLPTPNVPVGASVVHSSGKPTDTAVNSGSLDAAIEAMVQATPNGHILELQHESNNDGLTGSQITARIAAKNRLYDIKQTVKPGVLVAHTFTGGFWASYGNDATRDSWLATARGDLLGLDADGVHDTTGPTYDMTYADEVANVLRYLTRFTFKWDGWTVPECGTSRQPWDTAGSARATWLRDQAAILTNNGAYAVMAYDYNTSAHNTATDYNQLKTGTPEFTVGSSPI
jgi:hypothetical protein